MKTLHVASQDAPPRPARPACIALHPDGDRIFSTITSDGITISTLATRRPTGLLPTSARIVQMVVEPRGKQLYALSTTGLTCWDLERCAPVNAIEAGSFFAGTIRFTAAGQGRILAGDDAKLTLWDLATGAPIRRFEGGSQWLRALMLSPDARHALIVDAERTLRRFDLEIGSCVGTWEPTQYGDPRTPLLDLVLHPNGRDVIATTLVETMLWDTQLEAHRWKTSGPTPSIETAIFQPSGTLALVKGHNGDHEIWDLHDGRVRRPPGPPLGAWGFSAFCLDPRYLVISSPGGGGFRTIDLARGLVGAPEGVRPFTVRRFLMHPDGRRLITVDAEDEVTLWGLPHTTCAGSLLPREEHGRPRGGLVAMSAQSRRALSTDAQGWVRLWDVAEGTCRRIARYFEPMGSIEFSVDDRYGLFELTDRTLVWDLYAGEQPTEVTSPEIRERVIAGSRARVSAEIAAGKALDEIAPAVFATLDRITLHPDGDRALGVGDERVHLWSVARRELLHSLPLPGETVIHVAVDPRGQHALLVLSREMRLWDLETGEIVEQWKPDDWRLDDVITSASIGFGGIIAVAGANHLRFLRAEGPPREAAPLETGLRSGNPDSPPRNGKRIKLWIEDLADGWARAGKRPEDLLGVWDVAIAACWRISVGGKKEGMSADAHELVTRSFKAHEPRYHGLLASRDTCDRCRESYLVENLSFCTHCPRLTCYRCVGDLPLHENGNRRCGCAGDGEIVG